MIQWTVFAASGFISTGPKKDLSYTYDPVIVASLRFENGAVGKQKKALLKTLIAEIRVEGNEAAPLYRLPPTPMTAPRGSRGPPRLSCAPTSGSRAPRR